MLPILQKNKWRLPTPTTQQTKTVIPESGTQPTLQVYKVMGVHASPAPVSPFQALAESLTAVQNNMNEKIATMQTSVNEGLSAIKELVTQPVTGLNPRFQAVEKYVPTIKKVDKKVAAIEPRLAKVESTINHLQACPSPITEGPGAATTSQHLSSFITDDMQHRVEALECKVDNNDKAMDVLVCWAGTMQKSHAHLKKQVQFNHAKLHSNDLLVGGIYEYKNQDNRKAAIKFFRECMKLTVQEADVIRAYRTGLPHTITKDGQNIRCLRQMIVRCTPRFRDTVLQHKKILGGQTDPQHHFTYFVSQYAPEAFKAANVKYKPEIETIFSKNAGLPAGAKKFARVVGTELSVNNKIQQDPMSPPTPHEVIHAMTAEAEKLNNFDFFTTESVQVEDSTFRGYAVWLNYLSTVYLAYIKVHILIPDAVHIMLAYTIPEGSSSCDDGESFGDLQIVKILKEQKLSNVAIFITRKKG